MPRLRQFVFDLAIRGKLAPQDAREEPASSLLARIQTEKAQLVNRGAIKDERHRTNVGTQNGSFAVPTSWRWSQLAQIGIVNPRNTAPDDNEASFAPMAAISPDYGAQNQYAVRRWGDVKSGFTHFADGDVGLAKITPCFQNGKSTVFRGLAGGIGAGTTELHVIRPVLVDSDYILIFLKSPYFVESGIARMTGTAGQKRVPTEYFAHSPISLPPLAEQRRIVAKVDELMALCDRLEAAQAERESRRDRLAASSLARLNNGSDAASFREHARFHLRHLPRLTTRPEHIKQLRQAILNLAVHGRLVAQDPTDEPASELLRYISIERDRLTKQRRLRQPAMHGRSRGSVTPFEAPTGWRWVRIGDLLKADSQNGFSKKPDEAIDGIPILRISAGTVRGDGVVAEEEHKLIGGVSAHDRDKYRLQPGDLLACRFNGNRTSVGRLSLYVGYLAIDPIYPDKLIRLRLMSQYVLPTLVRWFGASDVVRADVAGYCATTVGNWGISASNLKQVQLPIPPLAEQCRIVAKIEELMVLCGRLETHLSAMQSNSGRFVEAVLSKAMAAHCVNPSHKSLS